jgi:hypothetical protein
MNNEENKTLRIKPRSNRGDRPYRENRDDRGQRDSNETKEITAPVLDENGEVIGSTTTTVPKFYSSDIPPHLAGGATATPELTGATPDFVPPQDDADDTRLRCERPIEATSLYLYVRDLRVKQAEELVEIAKEAGIEGSNFMLKQELIFNILKVMAEANQGIIVVDGVLEIMPDGFGFLRSKAYNYRAGPDDVYISPNQIKRFSLRTGDTIEGEVRPPKARERYFALTHIVRVGEEEVEQSFS